MSSIRLALISLSLFAHVWAGSSFDGRPGTFVVMDTTLGRIVLQLDASKAPISTLNFIKYCESGHYNGTIFHRVMPDFMVQGGGFTESMDQKVPGMPPIKNEWRNGLVNKKYTIAMARTSDPDSATSQFFINTVDNDKLSDPSLYGGAAYAVFGSVVEGTAVVDKIRDVKCIKHPKYPGADPVTPATPVVITKATVTGDFDRPGLQAAVDKVLKRASAEMETLIANLEKENGGKFQTTASGLKYLAVKNGNGAKPGPTSTVTVHYEGKLVNGSVFDSSYARGQTLSFGLNQVIAGWTEGLQLMGIGAKYIFIIPSKIGYGSRGAPPTIPPNATLVFTVELFKVQ